MMRVDTAWARGAFIVALLSALGGCNGATSVRVELFSSRTLEAWSLALDVDGENIFDRDLPVDAGKPLVGELGGVVIVLPDREAEVTARVGGTTTDGDRIFALASGRVRPHERTELRIEYPGESADGGAPGLRVVVAGDGAGRVQGAGIDCPGTCEISPPSGFVASLRASASEGSTFTGWSGGGCSGVGDCDVTINGATEVTATFSRIYHQVALDVTAGAGASGTVVSTPSGIDCGATCTASFPHGTSLTLTAMPGAGDYVIWSGPCAGSGLTCTLSVSADLSLAVSFTGANYAFVTSTTYVPGNLGGLNGADAACAARALAAGLPGNYVAFMSATGQSASSRLGSANGWIRVDGRPFAGSRAMMFAGPNGNVYYPLRIDELGNDLRADPVLYTATGTGVTGATDNNTAGEWTNTAQSYHCGNLTAGTRGWTSDCIVAGFVEAHIYCFGTDLDATVTVPVPPAARIAFVSQSTFNPATGIAGADAVCAAQASAALLPGTYKALLATNTTSAASRFNALGAPWKRVDNVLVADSAQDLLTGNILAPIVLHADGSTNNNAFVHHGATSISAVGTASTTCANWSTNSAAASLQGGLSSVTQVGFFGASNVQQCAAGRAIFCLQE